MCQEDSGWLSKKGIIKYRLSTFWHQELSHLSSAILTNVIQNWQLHSVRVTTLFLISWQLPACIINLWHFSPPYWLYTLSCSHWKPLFPASYVYVLCLRASMCSLEFNQGYLTDQEGDAICLSLGNFVESTLVEKMTSKEQKMTGCRMRKKTRPLLSAPLPVPAARWGPHKVPQIFCFTALVGSFEK